jgi:peptidoglycan/xylan/chitin deacetylase (PgdA/CDA1 family)
MILIKRIINKLIMKQCLSRIDICNDRDVFLTFDDGPEPGITSFVLDELDKYNYKATFFCTGENAEKYPFLIQEIVKRGHKIGNHSYSHRHAYLQNAKQYVDDIDHANKILRTILFRPPNGCLLLSSWLKLRKKYNIIYWSIGSGDWRMGAHDYEKCMDDLKKTKKGDIVLFHFSEEHALKTAKLLPDYLEWLDKEGYVSKIL